MSLELYPEVVEAWALHQTLGRLGFELDEHVFLMFGKDASRPGTPQALFVTLRDGDVDRFVVNCGVLSANSEDVLKQWLAWIDEATRLSGPVLDAIMSRSVIMKHPDAVKQLALSIAAKGIEIPALRKAGGA